MEAMNQKIQAELWSVRWFQLLVLFIEWIHVHESTWDDNSGL